MKLYETGKWSAPPLKRLLVLRRAAAFAGTFNQADQHALAPKAPSHKEGR